MPFETDDFVVIEAWNDLPTRCECCAPNSRQLIWIRNGPGTKIGVCPSTRACIIARRNVPVLSAGIYHGALEGV